MRRRGSRGRETRRREGEEAREPRQRAEEAREPRQRGEEARRRGSIEEPVAGRRGEGKGDKRAHARR